MGASVLVRTRTVTLPTMGIPLEALPEQLRPRIGPDAPAPMRMMVARALLPMGPGDLFTALAYLISTETGELKETARKSLADIPQNVLNGVVKDLNHADLLDFALREFYENDAFAERLLINQNTPDEAVEWAARRVSARLIEIIGNNQERIVRHPALVEAIYYNPEAPMRVVTRVFETGVREGLNLHHIPGFKEIYTSIFGDMAGAALEDAEREHQTLDPEITQALIKELPEEIELEPEGALEDDDFISALKEASKADDETAAEEEGGMNTPLHVLIKGMSVSQKVRLALVGAKGARALLIKDPKAVVALAVLKSPQISEKEVAEFAKNKAISDRVISAICRNPKWVRDRYVRLGLIKHPKAPPGVTNRWVRQLSTKELKDISRSRDVPSHVSKLAKNLLQTRKR